MFDLSRLVFLNAVHRHGSVGAAARELGYTSSAVSQQVGKLDLTQVHASLAGGTDDSAQPILLSSSIDAPNLARNLPLGLAIGLILGLIVAWLIEHGAPKPVAGQRGTNDSRDDAQS